MQVGCETVKKNMRLLKHAVEGFSHANKRNSGDAATVVILGDSSLGVTPSAIGIAHNTFCLKSPLNC